MILAAREGYQALKGRLRGLSIGPMAWKYKVELPVLEAGT